MCSGEFLKDSSHTKQATSAFSLEAASAFSPKAFPFRASFPNDLGATWSPFFRGVTVRKPLLNRRLKVVQSSHPASMKCRQSIYVTIRNITNYIIGRLANSGHLTVYTFSEHCTA